MGRKPLVEVEVSQNESLERALKKFKKRVDKAGIVHEVRDRQFYTKPSEKRRKEIVRAKYREQMKNKK